MRTVSVKDFTLWPGLRHCSISEKSGEEYYHQILNSEFKKAIDEDTVLTVILDGTKGYPPSFLDEAFGNLVYDFALERVKRHLIIVSEVEPHWIKEIEKKTFVEWSKRREQNDPVKVTEKHVAWYRFVNGELQSREWSRP